MAGSGAVANALANQRVGLPAMDLVGPTVDDDIRRAIGRYGSDAVKQAVNITKMFEDGLCDAV